MKKIIPKITFAVTLFVAFLVFQSCKKDKAGVNFDEEMFTLSKENNCFTWYKNSDTLLAKSSGSAHAYPFLKTRFNSLAATKLDSDGKIIPGSVFPEGSLIVKELIDSDSSLARYAVLYKKSDNDYADEKGWIWGYINADGSVDISYTKKGNSCISCHTQSGNIDYLLMNTYFP